MVLLRLERLVEGYSLLANRIGRELGFDKRSRRLAEFLTQGCIARELFHGGGQSGHVIRPHGECRLSLDRDLAAARCICRCHWPPAGGSFEQTFRKAFTARCKHRE